MESWLFWIVLACILAVGEIMTLGFYLAPFAVGAVLAAVVDVIGAGVPLSAGVFIVSSVLLFALLRPVVRAHAKVPPQLRTGAAKLVGSRATVIEAICNDDGVGTVRIEGDVWTARSYDEDLEIPAGTRVEVMEIRGATAYVSP